MGLPLELPLISPPSGSPTISSPACSPCQASLPLSPAWTIRASHLHFVNSFLCIFYMLANLFCFGAGHQTVGEFQQRCISRVSTDANQKTLCWKNRYGYKETLYVYRVQRIDETSGWAERQWRGPSCTFTVMIGLCWVSIMSQASMNPVQHVHRWLRDVFRKKNGIKWEYFPLKS